MYRRCPLVLLSLLALGIASSSAPAQAGACDPKGQSDKQACKACVPTSIDYWLMSTRGACGPLPRIHHLIDRCWRTSTLDEYHAGDDPNVVTVFWVHGSLTSEAEAIQAGWQIAAQLKGCAPRLRLVIWSWHADREHRRRMPDWREQIGESYRDALPLARVLDATPADVPVTLVGYSLGAQVIVGAAHALGGGAICGETLPGPRVVDRRLRLVLMAGAVHNDWLSPGCPFDKALLPVEKMLVFVNPGDRALRRYWRVERNRGVQVMGETGVAGTGCLGPQAAKIRQLNVSGYVGERHRWANYVGSGVISQQIRPFAFAL